jgi:hypothetical protein
MECGMVNYPCAGITYTILGIKDNINLKPDLRSGVNSYSARHSLLSRVRRHFVRTAPEDPVYSYVARPKVYYRESMVGLLDLDIFDK